MRSCRLQWKIGLKLETEERNYEEDKMDNKFSEPGIFHSRTLMELKDETVKLSALFCFVLLW